ncbi:alpha/beta hydrolase family protein [Motilimonas eburnea]|uniref:alpha/beta hydrolase family protein n=1 Tax=Motilimonas eburnea TaxID=1737488 RepID=UPI001E61F1F0|nr:alpha/beta fold hydrolase [Motilimonas eburnea]MCE2571930.1 alpha/beta fold hydrolase [Motilimonas eburnea]
MKIRNLLMLALAFHLMINNAHANSVGFTQFSFLTDATRKAKASVWFPTLDNAPKIWIGENLAFVGTEVVENASLDVEQSPLVLLSHGYGGNWRNLNWLATALAQQGMIVAAVDHPGTTSLDRSPLSASKWWLRAADISALLDLLLADEKWRIAINPKDISVIGHSLGGWTAMLLVGAKFDRDTFQVQCKHYANPRTCGLATELGLDKRQPNEPADVVLLDKRIKKAITLDLGLARSLSIQSLNQVTTPTLILAAGVDIGDLPQAFESGYLAEHIALAQRRYKVYEQAAHFSFIQLCKPQAGQILEQEQVGDGIICVDAKGAHREQLHTRFFKDITDFLKQTL